MAWNSGPGRDVCESPRVVSGACGDNPTRPEALTSAIEAGPRRPSP